jgi:hypothetical protein
MLSEANDDDNDDECKDCCNCHQQAPVVIVVTGYLLIQLLIAFLHVLLRILHSASDVLEGLSLDFCRHSDVRGQ